MIAVPSLDGKGVLALKQEFSSYLVFCWVEETPKEEDDFSSK